jgi:hypothetical protein
MVSLQAPNAASDLTAHPRFPSYLREMVQAVLTGMWTLKLPYLQTVAPRTLVANVLQEQLGDRISEYIFVDFCAGAGGPTPSIERKVNARLREARSGRPANGADGGAQGPQGVDFVLTDIAPHLPAWEAAAKKSPHLHFVPRPVDASNAPADLLACVPGHGSLDRKVFRLFNLAFHHFDDPLAVQILRNSFDTADGFGIFELVDRSLGSFLLTTLMCPFILLITPLYFGTSPGWLFFTYVVPVVPLVIVFDGYVSGLRFRTPEQMGELIAKAGGADGWKFSSGSTWHTWPLGRFHYFVAKRVKS